MCACKKKKKKIQIKSSHFKNHVIFPNKDFYFDVTLHELKRKPSLHFRSSVRLLSRASVQIGQ